MGKPENAAIQKQCVFQLCQFSCFMQSSLLALTQTPPALPAPGDVRHSSQGEAELGPRPCPFRDSFTVPNSKNRQLPNRSCRKCPLPDMVCSVICPNGPYRIHAIRGLSPNAQYRIPFVRGFSRSALHLIWSVRGFSPNAPYLIRYVRGFSPNAPHLTGSDSNLVSGVGIFEQILGSRNPGPGSPNAQRLFKLRFT